MKTVKLKIKANELQDADVEFISLVERPANRIPFRITKSEDAGDNMTVKSYLRNLFSTKTETTDKPKMVAVVVAKSDLAELTDRLKTAGIDVATAVDGGDVVIFPQAEFSDEDVVPVKLNDSIAVLMDKKKYFDSYPMGSTLAEQVDIALFFPGVSTATDVLRGLVDKILFDARTADEARGKLKEAMTQYSKYVLSLADLLPDMAFKMEGIRTVVKDAKKCENVNTTVEGATVTDKTIVTKAEDKEGDACTNAKGEKGTMQMVAGSLACVAAKAKAEGDACEMDGVAGTWKDVDGKMTCVATAKKEETIVDPMAKVLEALTAMKTELSTSIGDVATRLTAIETESGALKDRVAAAEVLAKKAEDTVNGTVVVRGERSEVDLRRNAFGIKDTTKADSDIWAGSALDRIGS